jgi:hypothetical protein
MLTGISTKEDVLTYLSKWLDREYPIIDEDDELFTRLILASADDLINDDGADYWGNQSVKTLFQRAKDKLLGEVTQ